MAIRSCPPLTPTRAPRTISGIPKKDTPRKGSSFITLTTKTTKLRPDIGVSMNSEIFMCPLAEFMSHYLPEYSKEVVKEVISFLEKEGCLKPSLELPDDVASSTSGSSSEDRAPCSRVFSSFHEPRKVKEIQDSSREQQTTSSESKTNEKTAFDPLGRIGNMVRRALRTVKGLGVKVNSYSIRMCPDTTLQSEIKPCTHRIDAAMTKNKNQSSPLYVTDIVVPFEFKLTRSLGDIYQNRQQITSHVNHAMTEDARRVFMYGITMENDRASIWYFSRSHSVKALSFSVTENPEIFVEILVALFCATDEQLGYDPLVTFAGGRTYIYEFPSEDGSTYYKTTELVSQNRRLSLTGLSTRVWKVKQVVSAKDLTPVRGAEEIILKDVAVASDQRTEADIQHELFSDIKTFAGTNWLEDPIIKSFKKADRAPLSAALEGDSFKNFFSCIIGAHAGNLNRPVCPRAWLAPDTFPVPEAVQSVPYSVKVSNGALPVHRAFNQTRQCRYLYQDICTPLHDIPTLGEVVDILRQALIALQLMFCAGWVHRDVSAGNILAFRSTGEAPWQVKLADLEYAKRFPNSQLTSAEPKTGTPFFMPCEVQGLCYFEPLLLNDIPEEGESDDSDQDEQEEEEEEEKWPSRSIVTVTHNYQHDLESIWWIILWLITTRANEDLSREFGKNAFQQTMAREQGWARMHILAQALDSNPDILISLPSLLPPSFFKHLDALRQELYVQYRKRHANQGLDDRATYSYIAGRAFPNFFRQISRSQSKWSGIELVIGMEQQEVKPESLDSQESDGATDETPQATSNSKKRKAGDIDEGEMTEENSRDGNGDIPEVGPSKKARSLPGA